MWTGGLAFPPARTLGEPHKVPAPRILSRAPHPGAGFPTPYVAQERPGTDHKAMDQDPTPSHPASHLSPSQPPESQRPPMRPVGEGARPTRGAAGLWVAMGILCYLIFGLQLMNHAGPDELPDPADYSSIQLKLVGRYVVGIKSWGFPTGPAADQIDELADANVIDRFRAAILISEVVSPQAALDRLDTLDLLLEDSDDKQDIALLEDVNLLKRELTISAAEQTQATPENAGTEDSAPAETPDAPDVASTADVEPLTAAERQRLIDRHGWFGELAIVQVPGADPALKAAIDAGASRTMIALIIFFVIGAAAILAGFALFILALVLVATGRVRPLYTQMRARFPLKGNASLESAVLFLALFIGIQFVVGLLALVIDIKAVGKPVTLILMWLMGLVAFWPLFRGVSFAQLRAANGWHANGAGFRGVIREMALGFVGYLAGLPIVIAGALITLLLMTLTAVETTHPIQSDVEVRSAADAIYLYILAVLWAPIVEETIFRGAMFHNLRCSTGLLGSAFLTAFAFAVIHPQGYAAVPVLMALAINFAILREWRGSLIPSMTAHAVHNGAIITMLVLLLT